MIEGKEIVLPSGRFAAFRPITWGDVIASYSDSSPRMMATLASLICQIDGAPLTVELVIEMEISEFVPIVNIITEMMPKDFASKGVA